jgi:aryl-alcohol dehydrogenase-like predicted oxidoreductase
MKLQQPSCKKVREDPHLYCPNRANNIISVPKAPIGHNGPRSTRLAFDLMDLTTSCGATRPENVRSALLDQAQALDQHFQDPSDMYDDSENMLGNWFKGNSGKRKDMFLKIEFTSKDGAAAIGVASKHCKGACVQSLARMGVGKVGLHYYHRVDQKMPIEKTVEAIQ